jgi:flagellar biosynthetic protein FliR
LGSLDSVSVTAFWAFLQVFARVIALFLTAPVFGSREVPVQVRLGLAAVVSLALLPLARPTLTPSIPSTTAPMVAALAGEALIGALMGVVASLLFAAVRMSGEVLDYQIGFTQATTFNPQFNESVSPFAAFQTQYAVLLYLLANGHWLLLMALTRSFSTLPAAQLTLGPSLLHTFTDLAFQILVLGLEIAVPGAAILLIVDIALAILSRAVPQMPVYFVGMPVKILTGLAIAAVMAPLLGHAVSHLIFQSSDDLDRLLRVLHR